MKQSTHFRLIVSFLVFTTIGFSSSLAQAQWAGVIATGDPALTTDEANSIHETADGGYIVAGVKSYEGDDRAPTLIKLNSSGSVEWAKLFTADSADDVAIYSVRQTDDDSDGQRDDGFIAAGRYDNYALLVKLTATGDISWQQVRSFPGETSSKGLFYSVQQTSDGGYIAAGYCASQVGMAGVEAVLVAKYANNGNPSWWKCFADEYAYNNIAYSIQQTDDDHDGQSDDGYILAGTLFYFSNHRAGFSLKLSGSGSLEWGRRWFPSSWQDNAYSVQQTDDDADGMKDDGFIVAGGTFPHMGNTDFCITKLSNTGDREWMLISRLYPFDASDVAASIYQTYDGNYILAGHSDFGSNIRIIVVAKLNSVGAQLWARTFSENSETSSSSYRPVEISSRGAYLVAGSTFLLGDVSARDIVVMKFDNTGNIPNCSHLEEAEVFGGYSSENFDEYSAIEGPGGYAHIVLGDLVPSDHSMVGVPICPQQQSYPDVANAEAAAYGSSSLLGSGIFNGLSLLVIPISAVILLRIWRRKS